MGRTPCSEKVGLKKGRWTAEEDNILINYIKENGDGSWRSLPKNAGLLRCGKSCRLRWINYLREDLKRGNFSREEEEAIVKLHRSVGNKWALIASNLPGRTDNEVKNYWHSHLSRKIYSFRSCNGSMMAAAAIDMVKMAHATKRKGCRVSRAVAKKYNMPTFPKPSASSSSRTAKPGTVSSSTDRIQEATAEASGRNDLEALMEVVESESFNSNSLESLLGGLQNCPEFMESPEKMEKEIGAPGPNGMVGLSGISLNEEETGMKSVEPGLASSSSAHRNESDNGGASSQSESGDLYECFSPINSYFNPELLTWDATEYPVQGFQLWDQEYDHMLWPWEEQLDFFPKELFS